MAGLTDSISSLLSSIITTVQSIFMTLFHSVESVFVTIANTLQSVVELAGGIVNFILGISIPSLPQITIHAYERLTWRMQGML